MSHSRITIRRQSADDGILRLEFTISDGSCTFVNWAYADDAWVSRNAAGLQTFALQVHGGLYNLTLGEGGPEYAGGVVQARFHFYKPTALYVSTVQKSDYFDFKSQQVVTEGRLFLRTEPGLLDQFIKALPAITRADGQEATLRCIAL